MTIITKQKVTIVFRTNDILPRLVGGDNKFVAKCYLRSLPQGAGDMIKVEFFEGTEIYINPYMPDFIGIRAGWDDGITEINELIEVLG